MSKPIPALADGETLLATFTGSKSTYIKEHVLLAALGSVLAVGVLIWMGDPNYWVGPIAAVLAIGVRGVYVASEQIGMTWQLTDHRLITPTGMGVRRSDIAKVNTVFSAAQVVTTSGDKFMIKYLDDPKGVATTIMTAG